MSNPLVMVSSHVNVLPHFLWELCPNLIGHGLALSLETADWSVRDELSSLCLGSVSRSIAPRKRFVLLWNNVGIQCSSFQVKSNGRGVTNDSCTHCRRVALIRTRAPTAVASVRSVLKGVFATILQRMSKCAAEIDQLKQDIVFHKRLKGFEFTFHSTWGLFSPRQVDEGSMLLVEHIDWSPNDTTVDLGCGYGAIGLVIAKQTPGGVVHLVDKDFVAVEYTRKNAEFNGLSNCEVYLSNAFREVPSDIRFNCVVANLPANTGKEMLRIILNDAYCRLVPGGRIAVVTVSGLRKWIKRNFEEVFGNYTKRKQGKTYTVAVAEKNDDGVRIAT